MELIVILGMVGPTELIVIVLMPVLFFGLFFFLLRIFGAWLFRIDEVIILQKQIIEELKKMNGIKS